MSISKIGRSIRESATLTLNAKAAALKREGEPIIHLGGGEPKSKAPVEAIEAAVALLNTREVRYSPAAGIPELREAIVHYTDAYYGHRVSPANVIASAGAKQALMVCLQAVVNPGEEVIFPAPYWVSYPEMVKLCGGTPVPVFPGEASFHPRMEEIEKAVGPRTRAVLINSPNNPSGAMYPVEFTAELIRFCEEKDLYLIMDDIYHRLIFDGKEPVSPYRYTRNSGQSSRLVVINGVSKAYAMTGFRIGWAVADEQLIRVMTNIQAHQTSGPSVVMQRAACGAIMGDQSGVESLRSTLEKNRDLMLEGLQSFPGVRVSPPDGTFYCFADFSHYRKDSTSLAAFLLDKALVATVPGVEFGVDGFLRLSTCGSAGDITDGIRRMKWALAPDAPREITLGTRKAVRDWK